MTNVDQVCFSGNNHMANCESGLKSDFSHCKDTGSMTK